MVLLSLLGLGNRAQAAPPLVQPSLAREDPAVVATLLESDDNLAALSKAALLRRAIGPSSLATADIERFLSALTRLAAAGSVTPLDAAAAAAFLEDVLDEASWSDLALWQALLRRFLVALGGSQLVAVRIRAEVALAAHLWRQSCPIQGDDEACMKRLDAAALCEDAQAAAARSLRRLHPGRYVEFPCTSPNFAYRVYPRTASLASEAQQLLSGALRRIDSARVEPAAPGDPLDDAIAHALFLRAEPQFEASLALVRWKEAPATLDPNPHRFDPAISRGTAARERRRFKAWYFGRMTNLQQVRPQAAYQLVVAHDATPWAVAAQSRIAQLFLDYTDQVTGCAPPSVMEPGYDPTRVFRCCYFGDEPPLAQAKQRLAECTRNGSLLANPYVGFCLAALGKLSPLDWQRASEISPQPTGPSRLGLFLVPPTRLE